MPLLTFQPDAATTDAILQSIAADYSLSLTDIASQHHTTIEALTAWLTREDIDERLSAIESACARRARLTAANHLPAVAHVAKQALEEASDVLNLPPDYRTQRSIALRIRATESARKAAALLLRIANFTPGPRRVRQNIAPTSPRVTPPPAQVIATLIESAPVAMAAALHAGTAPSAPTSATTTTAPTKSAPTTLPYVPPTDRAQSVPASLPPAESSPNAPTSTTSTARSALAPHAANPRHPQFSAAISEYFALARAAAEPALHWSPSPDARPPPRAPMRPLSPSATFLVHSP